MTFLAAAAASKTSTDKFKEIPAEFWWKLALGIVVIVVGVILLRKIAKVNKVILTVIILMVCSFIGFNWIYERNEPAWATPVVQWLANYFPSKGKVESKGH